MRLPAIKTNSSFAKFSQSLPSPFTQYLNIPTLTVLARQLETWSENFFYFKVSKGFIMCHTLCGLVRQGGQKYTAATLFPRPELSLPLLWPLPSLHFLRQANRNVFLSFTQTAWTFRLEFPHAPELGLSSFLGYLFRSMATTVRPAIDFLDMGQAWPHGPTQHSLRPRYQIP